jgi:hypothetical protein
MGKWLYRSTFSSPRHLFEVSDLLHASPALSPGKPSVTIGYETDWARGPIKTIWRIENSWSYQDSNSHPSILWPVTLTMPTGLLFISNEFLKVAVLLGPFCVVCYTHYLTSIHKPWIGFIYMINRISMIRGKHFVINYIVFPENRLDSPKEVLNFLKNGAILHSHRRENLRSYIGFPE